MESLEQEERSQPLDTAADSCGEEELCYSPSPERSGVADGSPPSPAAQSDLLDEPWTEDTHDLSPGRGNAGMESAAAGDVEEHLPVKNTENVVASENANNTSIKDSSSLHNGDSIPSGETSTSAGSPVKHVRKHDGASAKRPSTSLDSFASPRSDDATKSEHGDDSAAADEDRNFDEGREDYMEDEAAGSDLISDAYDSELGDEDDLLYDDVASEFDGSEASHYSGSSASFIEIDREIDEEIEGTAAERSVSPDECYDRPLRLNSEEERAEQRRMHREVRRRPSRREETIHRGEDREAAGRRYEARRHRLMSEEELALRHERRRRMPERMAHEGSSRRDRFGELSDRFSAQGALRRRKRGGRRERLKRMRRLDDEDLEVLERRRQVVQRRLAIREAEESAGLRDQQRSGPRLSSRSLREESRHSVHDSRYYRRDGRPPSHRERSPHRSPVRRVRSLHDMHRVSLRSRGRTPPRGLHDPPARYREDRHGRRHEEMRMRRHERALHRSVSPHRRREVERLPLSRSRGFPERPVSRRDLVSSYRTQTYRERSMSPRRRRHVSAREYQRPSPPHHRLSPRPMPRPERREEHVPRRRVTVGPPRSHARSPPRHFSPHREGRLSMRSRRAPLEVDDSRHRSRRSPPLRSLRPSSDKRHPLDFVHRKVRRK